MKYSVEVMRVREQTIQLNGWAVESNPDSVITYRVEDEADSRWRQRSFRREEMT